MISEKKRELLVQWNDLFLTTPYKTKIRASPKRNPYIKSYVFCSLNQLIYDTLISTGAFSKASSFLGSSTFNTPFSNFALILSVSTVLGRRYCFS